MQCNLRQISQQKKKQSDFLEEFGLSGENLSSIQSQITIDLVQNKGKQFMILSGDPMIGLLKLNHHSVTQEVNEPTNIEFKTIEGLKIEIEATCKVLCKLESLEYRRRFSSESIYKKKIEYTNRFRYLLALKESYIW